MAGPRVTHEWQSKSDEVDFLKNDGGFFAVSLTLSFENARKLRRDIRDCLKNAQKHGKNEIEVIAHWGKKTKASGEKKGGYRLRTKVKL